jgi:hypothetical protein
MSWFTRAELREKLKKINVVGTSGWKKAKLIATLTNLEQAHRKEVERDEAFRRVVRYRALAHKQKQWEAAQELAISQMVPDTAVPATSVNPLEDAIENKTFTHVYLRWIKRPDSAEAVQPTAVRIKINHGTTFVWPYLAAKQPVIAQYRRNDAWFELGVFLGIWSTQFPHWPKGQSAPALDEPKSTDLVWTFDTRRWI